MCGIAGYLKNPNNGGDIGAIVQKMTDAIRHRGPDAGDVWVEPSQQSFALGHRRLSIIDLSQAGAQPMMSASGRYIIVFNGEIYNFQILRTALEAKNHSFKGHSDTEVLLAAFEEWGIEQALTRAVGMFALALFDQKTKELTLARDRLGKKPLYFGWDKQGGNFAFASELKALVSDEYFQDLNINQEAVQLYLRWRYVPDPYSIYKNIYKLPPSTYMTLPLENFSNVFDPTQYFKTYWDFKNIVDQPKNNFDEAKTLKNLENIIEQAVEERMIADVPLGAFLSGGIDSSLIVAMMQKQSDAPINSFTIAFDDPLYNEADKARSIADHLGTNHTEMLLSADDALKTVDYLAQMFDEPFADPSAIPTYHVCRLAKTKMTVALSGDGGDETFGGYSFYSRIEKIASLMKIPKPLRQAAAQILAVMPLPGEKISNAQRQKISLMLKAKNPDDLYPLIHSYWYAVTGEKLNNDTATPYRDLSDALKNKNIIERAMAFDTRMFLAGDVLTKVDRCSMTHGLEVRAPLLDSRVIEYAWGMNFNLKINKGVQKYALKEILKNYVPQNLIDQKKQGFSIPHGRWLKDELRDWAEDLLSVEALEKYKLISPDLVTPYWQAHKQGRGDYGHYLWNIVSLQNWAKTWR